MLQQTPRAVTGEPPSDVILPPLDAVVLVIDVAAVVIIVGKSPVFPIGPLCRSGTFSQLNEMRVTSNKRNDVLKV